jgi:polyphosphate kinase 2
MSDGRDPEPVSLSVRQLSGDELAQEYQAPAERYEQEKTRHRKAVRRYRREKELKPYQAELVKLQQRFEKHMVRMIIVFEGRHASGKGGTIRRVTRYMNPKHYRVVALGKPTDEQRTQWYFQKYVTEFPTGWEIVLFDRSWYNRAMVEAVFGFCTEEEHKNFMRGVVGFEKDLVRQGIILIKLYFSVTREEQLRRFERRKNDLLRQWKLSEIDSQAQDRWDESTSMKYKMLKRTTNDEAPWTIIRSDDKHRARLSVMKVILDAVDYLVYGSGSGSYHGHQRRELVGFARSLPGRVAQLAVGCEEVESRS